jgi:hypothetical protein
MLGFLIGIFILNFWLDKQSTRITEIPLKPLELKGRTITKDFHLRTGDFSKHCIDNVVYIVSGNKLAVWINHKTLTPARCLVDKEGKVHIQKTIQKEKQ